jgi:hypothetical protein
MNKDRGASFAQLDRDWVAVEMYIHCYTHPLLGVRSSDKVLILLPNRR